VLFLEVTTLRLLYPNLALAVQVSVLAQAQECHPLCKIDFSSFVLNSILALHNRIPMLRVPLLKSEVRMSMQT